MKPVAPALFAATLALSGVVRAADVRWSMYSRSNGSFYVSRARTIGGIGGAVGARANVGARLVQSAVGRLSRAGTVFQLRVGGGVEGNWGRWSPAALGTFSLLAGQQTAYLSDERPMPLRGPAGALGLDLELLRFKFESTTVSSFQIGAGAGSDFPGVGLALSVGFFELSAAF